MATVVLVDTSVFLNVLGVPGFSQKRSVVMRDLERYLQDTTVSMLLPIAAIIEAGNHIAHISDGRLRRQHATKFSVQVEQALTGIAPWTPTQKLDADLIGACISSFPDHATRGIGIGDVSIIKEFDNVCKRHPTFRVVIWAIDTHLTAYDRPASLFGRREK